MSAYESIRVKELALKMIRKEYTYYVSHSIGLWGSLSDQLLSVFIIYDGYIIEMVLMPNCLLFF